MPRSSLTITLTSEDAVVIKRTLRAILRVYHKSDVAIDAETLADRMVAAVNAGERDFPRLLALALGPEAAPAHRAN